MLLPYCIVASTASLMVPVTGVRNAKVEEIAQDRLRCFYSIFDPGQLSAVTTEDALQVHAVVNAIFQQAAVIPFRFPTLVEGEAELEEFLRRHGPGYERTLTELRDAVQMEFIIFFETPPVEPPRAEQSGTKYLQSRRDAQQRLESTAEKAKSATGELLQDWRVKSSVLSGSLASPAKSGGLRCYALIKRGTIESFRQRMAKLEVGSGMKVAVSGPWPATEFMDGLDEENR